MGHAPAQALFWYLGLSMGTQRELRTGRHVTADVRASLLLPRGAAAAAAGLVLLTWHRASVAPPAEPDASLALEM